MEWRGIKGTVYTSVPMKRYTSMKVGGPARFLIYPADEADLSNLLLMLKGEGIPFRFLGKGTNIIVADRGLDMALIRTTRMKGLRYRKGKAGVTAEVSGGASLAAFIRENRKRGVSGLERLYWIPGTVGGAVRMNASSFGAAISDRLEAVRVTRADGTTTTRRKEDLSLGYRTSAVGRDECVVSATFLLSPREPGEIEKEMAYVYGERKKRHPMEYPSAGSIFKAASGEPAWRFIERAGLKGLKVGGACVSEKHANFIVNLGGARADDVKSLIDRTKKEVLGQCGISLEEEVELWGFDE